MIDLPEIASTDSILKAGGHIEKVGGVLSTTDMVKVWPVAFAWPSVAVYVTVVRPTLKKSPEL
jgi:hypothetical protein